MTQTLNILLSLTLYVTLGKLLAYPHFCLLINK